MRIFLDANILFSSQKDRPVLAASIRHLREILMTGDKTHFGPFYGQSIEGVIIHSPASLARRLDMPES